MSLRSIAIALALNGTISSCLAQITSTSDQGNVWWRPSPNFDARPEGAMVDTIVLHHTASDTLASTIHWFASTESQVSAHFTIGKDGLIVMHVNPFFRAWHAGVSEDVFGRKSVNGFSVGIEMVNRGDGTDPWPAVQVESARRLVGYLVEYRYRGQIRQITSHEYIAEPRGRKNDPLNFPWQVLEPLAKEWGFKLVYGQKPQTQLARS